MNNLLHAIKRNKILTLFFAFSMGLLFRYVYGIVKNTIFACIRNHDFGFTPTTPDIEFVLLTIKYNFAVDLASSFIASMVCGSLLIYVFQEKARYLCLGSVVVYLALDSRLRRFWKYEDFGSQISGLIGPLLAALVFISTVWLMVKLKNRITTGSTGSLRVP